MDRDHQLTFCKQCDNKAFSWEKGVICKLTGDVAAFQNACPDFCQNGEPSNNSNELSVNDLNEETQSSPAFYPKKPSLAPAKQNLSKSFISLALFILFFYWLFKLSIPYILVLVAVLLIHETGHFIVMKLYKYNDVSVFFIPLLGAITLGSKEKITQKQTINVLLAGPFPGIVIGMILYYYGVENSNAFLQTSAYLFLGINMLNLLPIMPLDGGKLVKVLFFDSNESITRAFTIISIIIFLFLAWDFKSLILLIIPFALANQLIIKHKQSKVIASCQSKGFDLNKTFDDLSNEEYWLLRDELGQKLNYLSKIITPGRYIVSEKEEIIITQIKNLLRASAIKDLNPGEKMAITLYLIMAIVLPLMFVLMMSSR